MIWAVLDESNIVTEIVTQEERPENGVKAPEGSGYAVGKVWTGWIFEDAA